MQIPQEVFDKVAEIRRLHDEAFHHYQKFDGHAKSYDGRIKLILDFGTVWEPNEAPAIHVSIDSYVVFQSWRDNWYETVDEALEDAKKWHAKAMAYNPSAEELQEMDDMAFEFLEELIKQRRLHIIEVSDEEKDKDQ